MPSGGATPCRPAGPIGKERIMTHTAKLGAAACACLLALSLGACGGGSDTGSGTTDPGNGQGSQRSEEHTSELQSPR